MKRRLNEMSLGRQLSRYNRVWLAVLIWLAIGAGIIFSAHAVIAASWARQASEEDWSEAYSPADMATTDGQEPLVNSLIGDAAIPALADTLSAPAGSTAEWFLFPVLTSTDGDLANTSPDSIGSVLLEAALLDVPTGSQERNLNCEYQSAADLASYYGWDTSWRDVFIVSGPDPGGDPNRGFVGKSIDDPPGSLFPNGYGVYAEPVARGLRRLGIQAVAHREKDVSWLKSRLSAGHPVVVWATYGMIVRPTVQWQTSDGVAVKGVPYEHTFTVIGYDADGVWVNDPYDATRQRYAWQAFDAAWALLERMALTIDEAPLK